MSFYLSGYFPFIEKISVATSSTKTICRWCILEKKFDTLVGWNLSSHVNLLSGIIFSHIN
jgi:hypothetical protein